MTAADHRIGCSSILSSATRSTLCVFLRLVLTSWRQSRLVLFLITLLLIMSTTRLSHGFPLTRQLLHEVADGGVEQQRQIRVSSQQQNEIGGASSIDQSGGLASQFPHFRHRHERKRMNRAKEALMYLRKFGYLEKRELNEENVESALKSFQQVLGVRETGELDKRTIDGMRMPRCGNSDVETPVHARRLRRRFAQMSRWLNKMDDRDVLHLQWFIEKYTKDIPRDSIRDVIKRAFKLWSDQVTIQSMRTLKLDFVEAQNVAQSDISIMWAEAEHGDAYPFDGPGNTTNILAHTFYPNYQETGSLNGDIHFDDYETWVLDDSTRDGGVRFPYVLVHEIGHALGLGHSRRQEAVMNPIYKQTPLNEIQLDIDDKCAVNWNYIGPTRTCLFIWLLIEYLPRAQETNTSHVGFGTSTPNTTGLDPNNFYSHAVGEQTLDDRVNRTLDGLQRVHIPRCTEENNLQHEYEALLMNKLEFPLDSAQRYGPVVCHFLDGLSEMLERRRRPSHASSTTTTGESENTWLLRPDERGDLIDSIVASDSTSIAAALRSSNRPLVHSYSSSPYAEEQYTAFHDGSSATLVNADSSTPPSDDDEDVEDSRRTNDGSPTTPDEIFPAERTSSTTNEENSVVDVFSREYFDESFYNQLFKLVVSSRWSSHRRSLSTTSSLLAASSTPPVSSS